MHRERILRDVRMELGRRAGQDVPAPPPVRIVIPDVPVARRIESMLERVAALAGKTLHARSVEEGDCVSVTQTNRRSRRMRHSCGSAGLRICRRSGRGLRIATSYGGSVRPARMASAARIMVWRIRGRWSCFQVARSTPDVCLAHIAVVPASKLLTGLDELYACSAATGRAGGSSGHVFITGMRGGEYRTDSDTRGAWPRGSACGGRRRVTVQRCGG